MTHHLDFVSQLSAEEGKQFQRVSHEMRVRKGQIIIGHGNGSNDVYFVLSGLFQVLIYSSTGKEVSIRTLGTGDLFGELAALDAGRRSANVVAASDGRLLHISGADFKTLLGKSPKAAMWMVHRLAFQVRSLTERIFELSALDVRSRLHCELLRLGFVAGVAQNQARIVQAPTHHELANRIGTHREAVTRELRELARRGVISQQRREFQILDIEELTRLVQRANGETIGIVPASGTLADPSLPRAPRRRNGAS